MPAADPASRGPRKHFRALTEDNGHAQVQQVTVAAVVKGDELVALLDDLIAAGHALTIGRTRDGGSLALGFMVGGKPIKRYTPHRESWLALLSELAD